MNRIKQLDPEQATGRAKDLYNGVEAKFGSVPNLFRVLGNSPAALEGYLNFSKALAGGGLGAKVREQIALTVAEANLCDYCLSAHTAIGRKLGLSDGDLADARRATAGTDKTDAILKFARSVVVQRGAVTDEDLGTARASGLSEGDIVETVATVAANLFSNYVNKVARTVVDFPEVKAGDISSAAETCSNRDKETSNNTTLVLGGTGKTGRRIVERLNAQNVPVRIGSRSGTPPFDWQDPSGWSAALQNVASVYISYHPDLAAPGAAEAIESLVKVASHSGVRKLVLLSGRGEEEAQRCERIVRESGIDWTIVRCSWFNQNFSENFLRDMVMGGVIALPVGDVKEPFVDVEDIAEVAVAALTDDRHSGQLYELTGPTLLTFPEAVAEIAKATGRDIQYQQISQKEFMDGLAAEHLPEELIQLLDYLFTTVLDGRNAYLADGVQRALGREPTDFATYARNAAQQGYWNAKREALATA